jgi:uncharacterized protein
MRRLLLVAALLLVGTMARADDVPFLSGRVVDTAHLLTPDAAQRIDATLAKLEHDTGAQVVVLTVPSIGDTPVEDYARHVAETWKLGRKGVDDGAVFVVAQKEHKLRIEVGYGLEPKLPDITCKRILDELVVPRFKDGDFPAGIEAGVDAIDKGVRGGEPLPPPKPLSPAVRGFENMPAVGKILMSIVFLFFMAPFAAAALRTSGCGGWFLWLFLTPFLVIFPYAFLGVLGLILPAVWLLAFPLLRLFGPKPTAPSTSAARRLSRGGWWGGPFGGFGGGGFGGGGFGGFSGGGGGGGFSGGGGSFGGGGASSSW